MDFKPYDPSELEDHEIPSINPSDIAHVEIFPPIGVGRVGDSGTISGRRVHDRDIEYYYGPEVPGRTDHRFGGFRDQYKAIKRQVSR